MLNRSLGKSVHQSSDINKLLNSGRLGASDIIEADSSYKIPFVILAAQNPKIHNEFALKPAIAGHNPEVPIFVATNFFENVRSLPNLFCAEINLNEMVIPNTSTATLSGGQLSYSSGLKSAQLGSGSEK